MDEQKTLLKLGAAVIAFALCLRLSGSAATAAGNLLEDPRLLSFAVFLQTGRTVRYPQTVTASAATEAATQAATEPTATQEPPATEPELPAFSAQELENLSLIYGCDYRPELESLLCAGLDWSLRGSAPTVLILHTHATECYTGDGQLSAEDERTLDAQYNMLSIGEAVAQALEAGGISVLHDRTLHDYPDYNTAYVSARESIRAYLEAYPSITLVVDIHRDAVTTQSGGQMTTSATAGGQASSQIMLVVGTDASGRSHPDWQVDLALALKLSAQLERKNPGITRPIYLRSERFNMDLTPGSLLVEIGASGDAHSQALVAADALAQAILALANGTSQ